MASRHRTRRVSTPEGGCGSGGTGETPSHYRITSGNALWSQAAEPPPVPRTLRGPLPAPVLSGEPLLGGLRVMRMQFIGGQVCVSVPS